MLVSKAAMRERNAHERSFPARPPGAEAAHGGGGHQISRRMTERLSRQRRRDFGAGAAHIRAAVFMESPISAISFLR
jgi:hypothetical protein